MRREGPEFRNPAIGRTSPSDSTSAPRRREPSGIVDELDWQYTRQDSNLQPSVPKTEDQYCQHQVHQRFATSPLAG